MRGQKWGERWGSNPRHQEPQSCALPTELRPPSLYRTRSEHRLARHTSLPDQAPEVARLAGLEPATLGLEGRCSIRMSYRRIQTLGGRLRFRMWSGQRDSNPRPPAPKAGALPDCAMPRTDLPGQPRRKAGDHTQRATHGQTKPLTGWPFRVAPVGRMTHHRALFQ